MRIARFETTGRVSRVSFGIVEGDQVTPINGDLFNLPLRLSGVQPSGAAVPLSSVKLLPPVVPRTMYAVALNYPSHLGEQVAAPRPEIFVKGLNSLAGPADKIILPEGSERVDYEGEIVVVIGRRCKKASVEDALSYVYGYTCGNDVSARDWQRGDRQWFRGKSCDTFGVLGPWIVDGLDAENIELCTRLNGEEVQHCNSREMVNSIAETISFISQFATLDAGDVIFTGTSGQPRQMKPGDVVEVDVGGVGVLHNEVIADPVPSNWTDKR